MTRPAHLHPVIAKALECWPRADAELAAEVVGRALDGLPHDLCHQAWSESRLGRRGFPFELAFSDAGDGLRYTLEVDRPDRACHRRLPRAAEVAASLGACDWPEDVMAALERLHRDHRDALRFGAWLGVRHRGGGCQRKRLGFKLYAELPAAAASWVEGLEARWRYSTWGGARPVLLGVEARRLEVYYQTLSPMPHELPTVLGRAGFGAGQAEVLRRSLEQAYGLSLERGMPAPEVGMSYALGGEAAGVEAFTLYHPADAVFGGDGSIRRHWLELAARRDGGPYDAISQPLDGRTGGNLHHGMFGIVVAKQGPSSLALGLTPPRPLATASCRTRRSTSHRRPGRHDSDPAAFAPAGRKGQNHDCADSH